MEEEYRRKQENILLGIVEENQQKFYQKLQQTVEQNEETLKTNKDSGARKTSQTWDEVYKEEKQKQNLVKPQNFDDFKSLEIEKEKILRDLQILTAKFSDAKKQEECLDTKTKEAENDLRNAEHFVITIETKLNQNIRVLKNIERSLLKYTKMEKPKLRSEIEAVKKGCDLLKTSEEQEYKDLSCRLDLLQQKEIKTVQTILMKEIRTSEIEDEIGITTRKMEVLKLKMEKEKQEQNLLKEMGAKKIFDLKSTLALTLAVVDTHRRLKFGTETGATLSEE